MHRLFVALRPPERMRAALLAVACDLPGARWQSDEQLHVTLRFIGEVDARVADDIATALASIRQPAFELSLAALGAFSQRGRGASLWAGVTPHDQVAAMHRKVDHALVRAGLPPERRAYVPHVTLARFARGATPSPAGMAWLRPPPPVTAGFAWFGLYESHLARTGASYMLAQRYPLAPA